MKYIVLVTRADNSRSCYGPMTMNQAIVAKAQMTGWNNGATVEIIHLTMLAPKLEATA